MNKYMFIKDPFKDPFRMANAILLAGNQVMNNLNLTQLMRSIGFYFAPLCVH